MKNITPKYGAIREMLWLNDGLIILEEFYNYPTDKLDRNLYRVDQNGNTLWVAEMPNPNVENDYYVGFYQYTDSILSAGSGDGWSCQIDINTGKIINKLWSKC